MIKCRIALMENHLATSDTTLGYCYFPEPPVELNPDAFGVQGAAIPTAKQPGNLNVGGKPYMIIGSRWEITELAQPGDTGLPEAILMVAVMAPPKAASLVRAPAAAMDLLNGRNMNG